MGDNRLKTISQCEIKTLDNQLKGRYNRVIQLDKGVNRMSRYTMNIGLANPFTGENNSVKQTLSKAFQFIGDIDGISIQESETERTVVIDFNTISDSLEVLATALDQDCVAMFDNERQEGYLFGEKAQAWAPFNREFFLTN